jgi:uncharacterized damage-inducible protein DinB
MKTAFQWGLELLSKEVALYSDEQLLRETSGQVNNSAGTLCLHLLGNLNHFLGAQIGNTGYVRDRDAEFSRRNVPRSELLDGVAATQSMIAELPTCTEQQMQELIEVPIRDEKITRELWLMHLVGHLNYHVGQISYHRRLTQGA